MDAVRDASADGSPAWTLDASGYDAQAPLRDAAVDASTTHPLRVFAKQDFKVGRLVADESYLYWTEEEGIARMPLAGGQRELFISGQVAPSHLTRDGDQLYWINLGKRGTSSNVASSIVKADRDGSDLTVLADQLLKDGLFRTFVDIQADADRLYVLETGGPHALYTDGAIQTLPKTGGAMTPLVTGLRSAKALAHDAQRLYVGWANTNNDGAIDSYPLQGGSATMLAVAGRGFRDMLQIGAELWWAHDARSIRHVSHGGTPSTFHDAADPSRIRCLASDGAHLYWGETSEGGSLYKRAVTGGETVRLAEGYGRDCQSLLAAHDELFWSNEDGRLFHVVK